MWVIHVHLTINVEISCYSPIVLFVINVYTQNGILIYIKINLYQSSEWAYIFKDTN